MYSEQQARDAIAAKQIAELDKQLQLLIHKDTVVEQYKYNLPYRILFDYSYHLIDRDFMEVTLTPYYPLPAKPKAAQNEKPCTSRPTAWDLETEQGQQAWLYWFMVFILPYEDMIPTFSMFDMFGDTKHTQQELDERKGYYLGLIKKCTEQPELYNHEVPHKCISDYDNYEVGSCYMWYDAIGQEPTPPNTDTDTALAIMYHERAIQQAYYGDDYILESKDRYSIVYRIELIINRLETEKKTA